MSAQRAIVMILTVWVGLIVTSSLQALSPWRVPTPEVALLVVLYLGLGGGGTAPGHVGVALVIGYLADLFAGSPKGLESLTLGVAMVLAARRLLAARRGYAVAHGGHRAGGGAGARPVRARHLVLALRR